MQNKVLRVSLSLKRVCFITYAKPRSIRNAFRGDWIRDETFPLVFYDFYLLLPKLYVCFLYLNPTPMLLKNNAIKKRFSYRASVIWNTLPDEEKIIVTKKLRAN